ADAELAAFGVSDLGREHEPVPDGHALVADILGEGLGELLACGEGVGGVGRGRLAGDDTGGDEAGGGDAGGGEQSTGATTHQVPLWSATKRRGSLVRRFEARRVPAGPSRSGGAGRATCPPRVRPR